MFETTFTETPMFETLLAVCIGIGLAASCGFRVFVPLLVLSIAVRAGVVPPAEGFEWLGTWPAIAALGIATLLEIGAYYIPWLDNLLDLVTAPAAVIAGVLAVAASVDDVHPLLQWSAAVIGGGGAAGAIKAGTVGARGLSSFSTGGFGNFVVSTIEWVGSLLLSLLAVVLPLLAALISLVLIAVLGRFAIRLGARRRRRAAASGPGKPPEA